MQKRNSDTAPRIPLKSRSTDDLVTLIDSGKFIAEVAREWGVHRVNLSAWIKSDLDRTMRVQAARRRQAEHWDLQAEAVLLALQKGSSPAEIARARELASHYRWRARAFDVKQYGASLAVQTDPPPKLTAPNISVDDLRAIAAGGDVGG